MRNMVAAGSRCDRARAVIAGSLLFFPPSSDHARVHLCRPGTMRHDSECGVEWSARATDFRGSIPVYGHVPTTARRHSLGAKVETWNSVWGWSGG